MQYVVCGTIYIQIEHFQEKLQKKLLRTILSSDVSSYVLSLFVIQCKLIIQTLLQALNFTFEGAQQFSSGKGHFYKENVNEKNCIEKGTRAKAQGTTAIAVCAMG